MTSIILQKALGQGWTQSALCDQGLISLNKFVPGNWIEGGTLPSWRMRVLKSAGWGLFDYKDERYLMPDPELASFALGTAYKDYLKVVNGRGAAGPSRYAGAYNDLIDCILHNDCLEGQMSLASGAALLYPPSFDAIGPRESIERRMHLALRSGWVMVNPITEGSDLFFLPPKAIIRGNKVTPDDAQVSRGVLQRLYKTGLIALRARGFDKGRIAPAVFSMPPRSAKGQTWRDFIVDQRARWGNAAVTPVVDFAEYPWLSDLPELAAFLQKHHPYVEHFDLMRIEHHLSAWRRTADFDAMGKTTGGVKGVMGEIAARQKIVDEYRSSESTESVLVVAPQIVSGGDVLERSDAMIVAMDGDTAVIERVWEVITSGKDSAIAEANSQHRATVEAYRKGGVIFRDACGGVFKCETAILPDAAIETYAAVVRGDDTDMDAVLDGLRERLVAMMEMDLVGSRVRDSFVPMLEELWQILSDPQSVKWLMRLLGAQSSAAGRIYVRGLLKESGRVVGLRIVGAEEARNLGGAYFFLGFDPVDEGYALREGKGTGALGLSLPVVESSLGRQLDAVEKAFFAGVLGTRKHSRDKNGRLTVKGLAYHLRAHGIERLLELARFVGADTPDGRLCVMGNVEDDGRVTGLRIVGIEEVGDIGEKAFSLGFDPVDEGYVLREAQGRSALDLALPWVEQGLGHKLEFVEKSFLARALGTQKKSGGEDQRITVESLAGYLRTYGIERLLEIAHLVGTDIPDGRLYVTGRVRRGGKVTGLRIIDPEEAGDVVEKSFFLGFDPTDEGYALREAQDRGALDLALPWVEQGLGHKLEFVEKSFLARALGTQKKFNGGDERITVKSLAGYVRAHGIERLLQIANLVGSDIPDGRLCVTGRVRSSGKVTGVRIADAEEAEILDYKYFLLGFDPRDGAYHLDRKNIRAHHTLKEAILS